jgi:hypothetical protein
MGIRRGRQTDAGRKDHEARRRTLFCPARGLLFVGRSKNEPDLEINPNLPDGTGKRSLPVAVDRIP